MVAHHTHPALASILIVASWTSLGGCADDSSASTAGPGGTTSQADSSTGAGPGPGGSVTSVGAVDSTDGSTSGPVDATGDPGGTSTDDGTLPTTGRNESTGTTTTGGEYLCDSATACDELMADFVPCGGDPIGDWEYTDACRPFIQGEPDPLCPTDVEEQRIGGADGLVVFGETELYSVGNLSQRRIAHTAVTLSCQDEFASCDEVCAVEEAERANSAAELCCEASSDDVCDIWWSWDDPQVIYPLAYTTEGTSMSWGTTEMEYCVDGDTMTIATLDSEPPWIHVYTRL
ncbi:MAG: hypothetical protein AAF721_25190 [Myxococcota bacterium]